MNKADFFYSLHHRDRAFIIPNPYDRGTARILAGLGYEALATTSAGAAFTQGLADGVLGRERMLAHVAEIAAATDLPVSADLENCFADDPEGAAGTIRVAGQTGIVGGSIEDNAAPPNRRIYEIGHAADRVRAAAEAARALPFKFTLTARAENYLAGNPDLADTIRRLQAYQEAGADVLYAPGLTRREDIAEVVRSVDRPVNVLGGMPGLKLNADELSAIGVKRISIGSALARAALAGFLAAAHEMRDHGTFNYVDAAAAGSREVPAVFTEPRRTSKP
jgi:2-methylisocitrate lyase-like PEP mutase family enzyme